MAAGNASLLSLFFFKGVLHITRRLAGDIPSPAWYASGRLECFIFRVQASPVFKLR